MQIVSVFPVRNAAYEQEAEQDGNLQRLVCARLYYLMRNTFCWFSQIASQHKMSNLERKVVP